jgi:hypothetical protein
MRSEDDDIWEEAWDEEGHLYFINKATGESNVDMQRKNLEMQRNVKLTKLRDEVTEECAVQEKRKALLRAHFAPGGTNMASVSKNIHSKDTKQNAYHECLDEEIKAKIGKNEDDLSFFWTNVTVCGILSEGNAKVWAA